LFWFLVWHKINFLQNVLEYSTVENGFDDRAFSKSMNFTTGNQHDFVHLFISDLQNGTDSTRIMRKRSAGEGHTRELSANL